MVDLLLAAMNLINKLITSFYPLKVGASLLSLSQLFIRSRLSPRSSHLSDSRVL